MIIIIDTDLEIFLLLKYTHFTFSYMTVVAAASKLNQIFTEVGR